MPFTINSFLRSQLESKLYWFKMTLDLFHYIFLLMLAELDNFMSLVHPSLEINHLSFLIWHKSFHLNIKWCRRVGYSYYNVMSFRNLNIHFASTRMKFLVISTCKNILKSSIAGKLIFNLKKIKIRISIISWWKVILKVWHLILP